MFAAGDGYNLSKCDTSARCKMIIRAANRICAAASSTCSPAEKAGTAAFTPGSAHYNKLVADIGNEDWVRESFAQVISGAVVIAPPPVRLAPPIVGGGGGGGAGGLLPPGAAEDPLTSYPRYKGVTNPLDALTTAAGYLRLGGGVPGPLHVKELAESGNTYGDDFAKETGIENPGSGVPGESGSTNLDYLWSFEGGLVKPFVNDEGNGFELNFGAIYEQIRTSNPDDPDGTPTTPPADIVSLRALIGGAITHQTTKWYISAGGSLQLGYTFLAGGNGIKTPRSKKLDGDDFNYIDVVAGPELRAGLWAQRNSFSVEAFVNGGWTVLESLYQDQEPANSGGTPDKVGPDQRVSAGIGARF